MAAAATDKVRKKKSNFSTTLSSGVNDSTGTIPLSSSSGLPTDTGVTLTIDRVDANGVSTPNFMERVTGIVGVNQLTGSTRGVEGSAQSHSSGAIVEDIWEAATWNDMCTAFLVNHNQSGYLKSGARIADTTEDHQYILAVSELAANRTVTMPLLLSADTFVFANHIQSFTNKTLYVSTLSGDTNMGATDNIKAGGSDPWRSITLKPGFVKPTTTSGCAASAQTESSSNKINYDSLDFDTSSEEHAYAIFTMPDSWDGGVIQFRTKWTAASGSGGVAWGLAGVSLDNDDAIDTAVGTEVVVTDTLITALDMHETSWSGDVTLANTPAAGDDIYLEIARVVANGSDTLGVDAKLISLQVRFRQGQFTD